MGSLKAASNFPMTPPFSCRNKKYKKLSSCETVWSAGPLVDGTLFGLVCLLRQLKYDLFFLFFFFKKFNFFPIENYYFYDRSRIPPVKDIMQTFYKNDFLIEALLEGISGISENAFIPRRNIKNLAIMKPQQSSHAKSVHS